jgi:hypothetical protein
MGSAGAGLSRAGVYVVGEWFRQGYRDGPFLFPAQYAGTFNMYVREMQILNRRRSEETQNLVAGMIEQRIKRKPTSSGRLVKVTRDSRNIEFRGTSSTGKLPPPNPFGWGVGKITFLDRSEAKYWRFIEEGSERTWVKRPFIGLPVLGAWGVGERGKVPPQSPPGAGKGERLSPYWLYGEGRRGRQSGASLHRISRETRLRLIEEGKGAKVRHETEPMWAYRDAYQIMRDKFIQDARSVFGKLPTERDVLLNTPYRSVGAVDAAFARYPRYRK